MAILYEPTHQRWIPIDLAWPCWQFAERAAAGHCDGLANAKFTKLVVAAKRMRIFKKVQASQVAPMHCTWMIKGRQGTA